jgi:hypothetical protein
MFLTQFGASLGNALYFLIIEETVFQVAQINYQQARAVDFVPYSLLDSDSQDRVWDCWKEADTGIVIPL